MSKCTNTLPIKEKKTSIKDRFFHHIVYLKGNQIIIQKRTGNDIWKGLYEFPLVETPDSPFGLIAYLKKKKVRTNGEPQTAFQTGHLLSHQKIHFTFHIINTLKFPPLEQEQQITDVDELPKFAVSKVTAEMVEKLTR